MGKGRRVILFLVEGPSDETALVGPFRSLLNTVYGEDEMGTKSEAFHCDVTTVRMFGGGRVLSVNPRDKMREIVRKFVKSRIETRHEYAASDLSRIVHIVDLDGAFVPETCIKTGDSSSFVYKADCIEVPDVERAIRRNREKASALNELASVHHLTFSGVRVPNDLYFMSRNLEHALYDLAEDCSDEEKEPLSIAFARRYRANPEGFACLLLSDVIRVPGNDLNETWAYAREGTNSLRRGSNLHMFLVELRQGEQA